MTRELGKDDLKYLHDKLSLMLNIGLPEYVFDPIFRFRRYLRSVDSDSSHKLLSEVDHMEEVYVGRADRLLDFVVSRVEEALNNEVISSSEIEDSLRDLAFTFQELHEFIIDFVDDATGRLEALRRDVGREGAKHVDEFAIMFSGVANEVDYMDGVVLDLLSEVFA